MSSQYREVRLKLHSVSEEGRMGCNTTISKKKIAFENAIFSETLAYLVEKMGDDEKQNRYLLAHHADIRKFDKRKNGRRTGYRYVVRSSKNGIDKFHGYVNPNAKGSRIYKTWSCKHYSTATEAANEVCSFLKSLKRS